MASGDNEDDVEDIVDSDGIRGTRHSSVEEENKTLARRWFEEGWCRGNLAIADEIFAADLTVRGQPVGPDGPRRSVRHRRLSFADLTVTIDRQVAEGEWVVTQFTSHARHVGEFCGVPPTGRSVTAAGIVIWRVVDGLVREDHNVFDRWSVVSQISADGP